MDFVVLVAAVDDTFRADAVTQTVEAEVGDLLIWMLGTVASDMAE